MQVAEILNRQGRRSKAQYLVAAVLHYESCAQASDVSCAPGVGVEVIEAAVRRVLQGKVESGADELRFLKEVHSVVGTFLELLIEGMSCMEAEIHVYEQPEKRIILGGINDFGGTTNFYREFMRFCSATHEPKLNLSYPVGGYFECMGIFLDEPSQPSRFFSIDPYGKERKAAGLYLVGYTRGYYGQTNDLPKRMLEFAKKNGLVFNGPVYQIYLFDEMSIADTNQYLLQVSAEVRETRRVPSRRPSRRV